MNPDDNSSHSLWWWEHIGPHVRTELLAAMLVVLSKETVVEGARGPADKILQGAVMLHAASHIKDSAAATRLTQEATKTLTNAVHQLAPPAR